MGKFLVKAFRILGLDETKSRWAVKKDFRVNVTCFFAFNADSLTESCSFWYGLKVLFIPHNLADKVVLDRLN